MTDNQPWGRPATPASATPAATVEPSGTKARNVRSKTRTALVGAVAGLVVIGGGVAVANASTSSSSSSTSTGPGPGGGTAGGGPGGTGGAEALRGALYGDFTVTATDGGYTTERLQSGTVTAVSATSITAKSADGHSTTFVVTSGTTVDNGNAAITDVKTGDTVTVVGTLAGDTATATTVTDTTVDSAGARPSAAAT